MIKFWMKVIGSILLDVVCAALFIWLIIWVGRSIGII